MSAEELSITDLVKGMDQSLDTYADLKGVDDVSDAAIGTAIQLSHLVGQLLFDADSPFDPKLTRLIVDEVEANPPKDEDTNANTLPKAFVLGLSIGLTMCVEGYRERMILNGIKESPKLD